MRKGKTEKGFLLFTVQGAFVLLAILSLLVGVNYFVDASQVITSRTHTQMAKLALRGSTVAVPENYNERVYQVAIVDEMEQIPQTIVIGSSRGMFLGERITGYRNLYNNCVSGACMEDYYALAGMYLEKFAKLPERIVMEVSPWVFYEGNPENRWMENYTYREACKKFYKMVNGRALEQKVDRENPYLSLPYFQYNLQMLKEQGSGAWKQAEAKVSTDQAEGADYPDGSIRYQAELENAGAERLKKVQSTNGAVTYESVDNMAQMDAGKTQAYENLLKYFMDNGTKVVLYMQPFSVTQCHYIYEENTNPAFREVESYLRDFGKRHGLKVVGGYDARQFGLSDRLFIDFMHLDQAGTQIVWNFGFAPRSR